MPSRRPLLCVVGSQALSSFGNQVSAIAVPWLTLDLTGKPLAAGTIAFATGLAMVVGALVGGVLTDRFGPRRVGIVADVLSGLSVAAIPLTFFADRLGFPALVVLTVLGALFDAPGMTARDTMIPAAARASDVPLLKAGSLQESIQGSAWLAGPLIGGWMVALVGAPWTLFVTTGVFILGAGLIVAAGRLPRPEGPPDTGYAAWLEGFRALRRHPLLWAITLLSMAYIAIAMPVMQVVMPVHFREAGASAGVLGTFLAVNAFAGVLGALVFAKFSERVRPFRYVLIVFSIFTALFGLFVLIPPTSWLLFPLAVVMGAAGAGLMPIFNTVYYALVPESQLGRVNGASMALSLSIAPVGALAFGALVQATGPIPGLWAYVGSLALLTLAWAIVPAYRLVDPVLHDKKQADAASRQSP